MVRFTERYSVKPQHGNRAAIQYDTYLCWAQHICGACLFRWLRSLMKTQRHRTAAALKKVNLGSCLMEACTQCLWYSGMSTQDGACTVALSEAEWTQVQNIRCCTFRMATNEGCSHCVSSTRRQMEAAAQLHHPSTRVHCHKTACAAAAREARALPAYRRLASA